MHFPNDFDPLKHYIFPSFWGLRPQTPTKGVSPPWTPLATPIGAKTTAILCQMDWAPPSRALLELDSAGQISKESGLRCHRQNLLPLPKQYEVHLGSRGSGQPGARPARTAFVAGEACHSQVKRMPLMCSQLWLLPSIISAPDGNLADLKTQVLRHFGHISCIVRLHARDCFAS